MEFCNKLTILSEIVEENHALIPVINRFGIKLGLGDKTIETFCKEQNLSIDFFLTILNTFINEDYFPENKLQKFDVESVIKYIQETDHYLLHIQLNNLEKHINAFMVLSDKKNTQLILIHQLFDNLKKELINQLEEGEIQKELPLALLYDLRSVLIKHISGNFNENLCYAVIFTTESFLKELQKQNRIREKVLKPMIDNLIISGIDNWQAFLADSNKIASNNNSALSQREIDVLRLIAKGLLNKEIADQLNISLNTVLSHRKNITTKLKIKTVSGLIFYCISNGYISNQDVNL